MSLGPLDHISPRNIPQSVMYLSLKESVKATDAFAHLQEGLQRTFTQAPWLRGTVHWQSKESTGWHPGQLEIRYSGPHTGLDDLLRFNELDTDKTYSDIRDAGYPLDVFGDEALIWTRPWNPDFDEGVPVFAAQANFLPGGCILAFSMASAALDGTGMLSAIKYWAEHCGQPTKGAIKSLPSEILDRAVLDRALAADENVPDSRADQLKITRQLVGLHPNPTGGFLGHKEHPEGEANMKHVLFYLPHPAYTTLRRECTAHLGNTNVTGNDIISALIWRSLMRAANATKPLRLVESELLRPFDARPSLASALPPPPGYLGNVNFESRVTMPLYALLTEQKEDGEGGGRIIASVAQAIRSASDRDAAPDRLRDAYAFLRASRDWGSLGWRATRCAPEAASVGVLSPIVLPFNDTCFGEGVFGNHGRPDAFRPLMGAANRRFRTCFVIPRKQHGGLEFVMTLSEEELRFLCEDEEFGRYAFPIK